MTKRCWSRIVYTPRTASAQISVIVSTSAVHTKPTGTTASDTSNATKSKLNSFTATRCHLLRKIFYKMRASVASLCAAGRRAAKYAESSPRRLRFNFHSLWSIWRRLCRGGARLSRSLAVVAGGQQLSPTCTQSQWRTGTRR